MYFIYRANVTFHDFAEEFFRGIVDANNPENAKEKVDKCIKTMLEGTLGEIPDHQVFIELTKLCDVIKDTQNGVICMSHEDDDLSTQPRTPNDIDCPSVYSERLHDESYCIHSTATGVIRKFDNVITGLSEEESNTVIYDMKYIINHLPDNKNNTAVMGALAAIAIDFLEASLLKNLDISDDVVNRNLRMLDRRLASLYHTAGNVTGKPIRPVGYFYCSSSMINTAVDELNHPRPLFTPDNPETLAPRIQFPTGGNVNYIINDITMSEYEDSLIDSFDEINKFLMQITEPTAELSVCADSDKLTEISNRTIGLEMLITEHARELDKINDKLRKLKKKLKKGRH